MTTSEQIISVINELCAKFGIAINWTSDNVIPYLEVLCEHIAKYKMYEAILAICITQMIVIALWIAFGIVYRKQGPDDASPGPFILLACTITFSVLAVTIAFCSIDTIIQAKIFPEKLILDYIINLTHTMS